MTRLEAVRYLINELHQYTLLWEEWAGERGFPTDVETAQQRDLEALLALGVTNEEITEAQ